MIYLHECIVWACHVLESLPNLVEIRWPPGTVSKRDRSVTYLFLLPLKVSTSR